MVKKYGRVRDTALWLEVEDVAKGKERPAIIRMTGFIHTEKEDISIFKVLREEVIRDYLRKTGEFRTLSVYLAAGDYFYRLFPYKENIEVSIRYSYHYESGIMDPKRKPKVVRYKGLFHPDKNPAPSNDGYSNRSVDDLNKLEPIEVHLELQDRREEVFRVKTTSGIFTNVDTETFIRGVTAYEMQKVRVDGKAPLDVIEIDKPDQTKTYEELFIPHATPLKDIPGFLQERRSGVYKQGIGTFLQEWRDNLTWFVFPLYKPERFKEDRYKAVIYAMPPEEIPGLDTTYREELKTIYIVTTGNSLQVDGGRNSELNDGVGFRFPDASAFMKKPVEITKEGVKANRGRLMFEAAHRERKDQLQYMPVGDPTSNIFFESSRILKQQFLLQTVAWENSDPEKIYPGMPCRYVYFDKGEYIELMGTIVTTYTVAAVNGSAGEEKPMVRGTQIILLLERKDREEKTYPSETFGATP